MIKGVDGSSNFFDIHSGGLKTNRDAWCFNFSSAVEANMARMIDFYNDQVAGFNRADNSITVDEFIDTDETKISWDRADKVRIARGERYDFDPYRVRLSFYRPFTKQHVYFDRKTNNTVYQLPSVFSTPSHANLGIYQVGVGSAVPFSVIMLNAIPNLHVTGAGSNWQFFPRWRYERVIDGTDALDLDVDSADADAGYRRIDNISDTTLLTYRSEFGEEVSTDDIFNFVYGLLHSPHYRDAFAADLKRMLPRIPPPVDAEQFYAFAHAGRVLAELHVGYEPSRRIRCPSTSLGRSMTTTATCGG